MNEKQIIGMFGALSQETRLRIMRFLVSRGDDGASAGAIGEEVDATSSRASFHLSALENAGLVSSERKSRHVIYRADFANLGNLVSFLLNDCCDNHPDVRACCLGESCSSPGGGCA